MYRAALFALVLAGIAHADANPPIRYHHGGTTVIMHSGTKPIQLVVGDNPLDNPHTFTCKSVAGCIVILSAAAYLANQNSDSGRLCPLIDGADGVPACPSPEDGANPDTFVAREMASVGAGQHTVQTIIRAGNPSATVMGWETDYTIYERRTKEPD